jgi:hypothetical protein
LLIGRFGEVSPRRTSPRTLSGAVAERHRKEEFGWRVKDTHLNSDLLKLKRAYVNPKGAPVVNLSGKVTDVAALTLVLTPLTRNNRPRRSRRR